MNIVDTSIIILYLFGMLAIGIIANKKQKSREDYYVAGRKLNSFSIMVLWVSSWIGGASIIGSAGKAYDQGITAIWYISVMAVGCTLFALSFSGIVKKAGDKLHCFTYPELIENRYDIRCRIIAGITTILAYIAYTGGQMLAIGNIIHVITGWDLFASFIAGNFVVIVYTVMGGYLAVTYTDLFQWSIMMLGIVFIGAPMAWSAVGGWTTIERALPASYFDVGAWGWGTIIGLVVTMTFSFFTAMDSYTRMFAAKDERAARNGTLLAVLFLVLIAFAATFLGLAARVLFPDLEGGGGAAMATLIKSLFPVGIKGLILIGILATIMSTADICILTASANLTEDIYHRLINPVASEKKLHYIGMISSLVIGILAALLAWKMNDILNILYSAFTINSAALFFPTLAMFYWRKATSRSAFYSMVFSLVTVLFWYLGRAMKWGTIFTLDPVWPGLIVSLLIFVPMSYLAEPNVANSK